MFTSGSATSEAPKEASPEVNTLIKAEIQSLWDRTVAHIRAAMEVLHSHLQVERGPDPDYDPSVEVMKELTRAIVNLRRPGPHNGDTDPGKQWPTVLSACGIMVTLLGAGYAGANKLGSMDSKIDAVQKTQAEEHQQREAERAETRELIRATNERINRLLEERDYTGRAHNANPQ